MTESVSGTTFNAVDPIIDSSGNYWNFGSISGVPPDLNVQKNSAGYNNGSHGVGLSLLYINHVVNVQNSLGNWFQDNGSGWTRLNVASSGDTITTTSGTLLFNSSGPIITLDAAPGHVCFNGVADTTTSNASTVLWYGGALYYENSSSAWFANTANVPSKWLSSAGDPRTPPTPSRAFITPGSGSFDDNSSNVYTIDASGNFKKNGTLLTGGTGTDMGAFLNSGVYGRDSSTKEWYLWNGTAFVGQTVSTSGSTVSDGVGFLILSNGSIATLNTSTNKIAFNGTDDSTTSNATLLLTYSGVLYYQDTTPAWHQNTALTAGSWSSASGDPRTNVPVFADEFQAASLSIGQHMDTTKTWSYVLWYAGTSPNTWDGSLNGNGFFVNPLNSSTPISGLYGVDGTDNAVLELFATPSMYSTACSNAPYVEAQMVASNFKRTYGYWEVRCKMDSVQGTNTAALWLMSNGTNGHYQEIDVLEANNQTGNATAFQTIHYDNNSQDQVATSYGTSIGGTAYDSTAYHVYAVNWQPDFTTFYIDGVQTLQVPTPSWYTDPMFPIVSTQAGSAGGWTPAIPSGATLPQHLYIDYIRCYPTKP